MLDDRARYERRRATVAIGLAFAVATLVNVGKPVHIDDAAHLAIAEHIREDPLHPMSGIVHWGDRPEPIHRLNQPHLFFYALAGAVAVDPSLVLAHLIVSLFVGLAAIALFSVARSLELDVPTSAWAAVVFVLGPAMLPSQNLMTDVPLVALLLCATALLARGVRRDAEPARGGAMHSLAAALTTTVACLVKYTGLVLLPALVVDALHRRRARRLAFVLVPIAGLGLYAMFNVWDYGGVHLFQRPIDSASVGGPLATVGVVAGRLGLFLVTLGALVPFALGALPGALRSTRGRAIAWGAVAFFVAGVLVGRALAAWGPDAIRGESVTTSVLRSVFATAGIAVAVHVVLAARRLVRGGGVRGRVAMILAVWGLSTLAFVVVLSPFVAVRHVLLALPAVLLLLLADERIPPSRIAAVVTIALGLAVAVADHRYAAVFRDEAPSLAAEAGDDRAVWFAGHWGFQHYAERAGMRAYVPGESDLAVGDVLVVPATVDRPPIADADRARTELRETRVVPGGALDLFRTVTTRLGFYSVWQGVPWTLTTEPLERFDVYEVRGPS